MRSSDNEAVQQLSAEELSHLELVPGTEIMHGNSVDCTDSSSSADILLIPQPTNDPHDPLNWSLKWKYLTLFIQFLFTFITIETALPIAPMVPLIQDEWNISDTQVNLLTGVLIICAGFSNFAIVPMSNTVGRRATCIVFCALLLAATIWEALSKSYGSLLAARVLNGICCGTGETIMIQVVADLFFLHERGSFTGVYFANFASGSYLGPVISGAISERYGWRSFFWLAAIQFFIVLILLVCCFPETKYRRDKAQVENLSPRQPAMTASQKSSSDALTSTTSITYQGRPSRSQFRPWQHVDSRWRQLLFIDVILPTKLFAFPIILWSAFMLAGGTDILILWNLTESGLFSAAPYNWNTSEVGLSNLSFLVGSIVGLFTAGPFSDWIAARATRKNKGIREAEMRLPALIPYAIIMIVAIVLGGIGSEDHWAWEIIVVVAYGMTGVALPSIPTIAIAYAVDCYKPVSGGIMVVGTVFKNSIGFAMSYWIPPLVASRGYIATSMVTLGLVTGAYTLGIPIYFYGKRLRRITRNSDIHMMEAHF